MIENRRIFQRPRHERQRTVPALVTLLFLLAAFACGIMGCSKQEQAGGRMETFTVASLPWPGATPLYVGIEKGYFRDEKLDLRLQHVATGKVGLEAAVSGKADCAGAADTPIARAAVNGDAISVIATIANLQRAIMIIARKESGISKPDDLKGRSIGVTKGAGAEFFLHIYLVAYKINPVDVRIVDISPDKIVDALLNGEVDAVSTWSPFKLQLLDKLGSNAVVLTDPALYLQTYNLVVPRHLVRSNPERIKKFLRALLRSNTFIKENADEALGIMSKYIGAESVLYQREWTDYFFTVVLDQSLVVNMEDQARWMIKQSPGIARTTPNFMEYIEVGPLKALQPQAVRIIGK